MVIKLEETNRYITRGIQDMNQKNPLTFLMLWDLYDSMEIAEKDYLQVFVLRMEVTMKGIVQIIEHSQEVPAYSKTYRYYTERPVEGKVYIIIEDDHSTMLLADEY